MESKMEAKLEADRKMMERLGTDHDEDIWALINAHKQVREEGEGGPAIPWYQTNSELDKELQQRWFDATLVPWKEPVLEESAQVFSAVERLGLAVPFRLPVNEVSPFSIRMIKEIMHFNHLKTVWDLHAAGTFKVFKALEARSCWRDVTVEDVGAALWLSTEGELAHVVHRTYPRAKIRHLFRASSDQNPDQMWSTYSVRSLIDDKLKILLPAVTAFFIPAADYGCLLRVPTWVFKYVTDGLSGEQTNVAHIVHGMFVSCCEHLQTHPDGMKVLTRLAPLLFPIYARKGWLTYLEFEWYVKARTRIRQLLREKKVEGEWQMILNSLKPSVDPEPEQLPRAEKTEEQGNLPQQASKTVSERQSTPLMRSLRWQGRARTSAGRSRTRVRGNPSRQTWDQLLATSQWQGRLRSLPRQGAGEASAKEAHKSPLAASGKRGRSQDLERLREAVKRRKERELKTVQAEKSDKKGEGYEFLNGMLVKSSACRTLQSILENTSEVPIQQRRTEVVMRASMRDMLGAPSINEEQTEADTLAGQRNEHESPRLASVPASVHPDILREQNIGDDAESASIQPGSLGVLVRQVEDQSRDQLTSDTARANLGTLGNYRAENQLESTSAQPDTSKVPGHMHIVVDQSDTLSARVQLGTLDTLGLPVAGNQLDSASAPPDILRGRRVEDLLDSASAKPVSGTLGVQRVGDQVDSGFASAGRASTFGGQRDGSQQELSPAQPDTSGAQGFCGDHGDSAFRIKYEAMRKEIASNLMSARRDIQREIQRSWAEAGRHLMEKMTDAAERQMTSIDNMKQMETEWLADKENLENELAMWRNKADTMLENIGRMNFLENQNNDLQHCLGNVTAERDRWKVFGELFPTKVAAENLIKERDDMQDRLSNTVKALGIEECKVVYLRKCYEELKVERDTWAVFQLEGLFPSKAVAENLMKEREGLMERLAITETALGKEEAKVAALQHEIRILRPELMQGLLGSTSSSASARKGAD